MGATGLWNIDRSRAARETLENYRELSYYEIWLSGLEQLLLGSGAVRAAELAQGRSLQPALPVQRVLHAEDVSAALAGGAPTVRPPSTRARFAVGQWVRTNLGVPPHHTRLPGYARGKRGRVERVHGAHVFADANASGRGESPKWLYTVSFDAQELWGASHASGASAVSIDAWEPYLDPYD